MLKAVIFYLNKQTNFSFDLPLFSSLQQNSIITIVKNEPFHQRDSLSTIINNSSLTPEQCLLITDTREIAKEAKGLNLTCIGIQTSFLEGFFTGADCIIQSIGDLDYESILEEYNHAHNLPSTIMVTTRLVIRELTTDDITSMYKLYSNKDYVRFIPDLDSLETEIEKQRAYITQVYNLFRFGLWGVFLKETNKLIGRCGLQCIELGDTTEIELAYLIDPTYSKQGYGYEAARGILEYAKEHLNLTSVVAQIHKDNLPSIHLAKKLGFSYEKPLDKTQHLIYRIDFEP